MPLMPFLHVIWYSRLLLAHCSLVQTRQQAFVVFTACDAKPYSTEHAQPDFNELLYCRTGRVQVTLATKLLDVGLLVLLTRVPTHGTLNICLLIAIHLVRTSVANCVKCGLRAAWHLLTSYALTPDARRGIMRGVMMDIVDKKHRGSRRAVAIALHVSHSCLTCLNLQRSTAWRACACCPGAALQRWAGEPGLHAADCSFSEFHSLLRRILVQTYGFKATFLITAGLKLLGWVRMSYAHPAA